VQCEESVVFGAKKPCVSELSLAWSICEGNN
jgi:hypothetical protein